MKYTFFVILLFVFSLDVNGQSSGTSSKSKKPKEYIYPSSVLKMNTTSLLFKTFAFQYEYKFTPHWSFAAGVIYRPLSSFLLYSAYGENINSGFTTHARNAFSSMKLSRIAFTPEFRYYFKNTAPRGIYLAPYLRYSRDSSPFDLNYMASNSSSLNEKTTTVNLIERRVGVGALFGLQVISKKKLAVDFWFLGPGLCNISTNVSTKMNMTELTQADRNAISTDLEEISSVAIKNDNNGFSGSSTTYSFFMRMIGVNLGVNF